MFWDSKTQPKFDAPGIRVSDSPAKLGVTMMELLKS